MPRTRRRKEGEGASYDGFLYSDGRNVECPSPEECELPVDVLSPCMSLVPTEVSADVGTEVPGGFFSARVAVAFLAAARRDLVRAALRPALRRERVRAAFRAAAAFCPRLLRFCAMAEH